MHELKKRGSLTIAKDGAFGASLLLTPPAYNINVPILPVHCAVSLHTSAWHAPVGTPAADMASSLVQRDMLRAPMYAAGNPDSLSQ
jgi:hypothetical protein